MDCGKFEVYENADMTIYGACSVKEKGCPLKKKKPITKEHIQNIVLSLEKTIQELKESIQ
jgi:hypothetical protein